MAKILLVLLVVLIGLWALFGRRRIERERPQAPPRAPSAVGDAMVACAHCGVHLPSAEALTDEAGRRYCSEAHRRAGPA